MIAEAYTEDAIARRHLDAMVRNTEQMMKRAVLTGTAIGTVTRRPNLNDDTFTTRIDLGHKPLDAQGVSFNGGATGTLIGKTDCIPADIDAHYAKLAIDPFEYSMANRLDAMQHTVIKYVTRFRDKGGIRDLHAARKTIDMLIAHEQKKGRA